MFGSVFDLGIILTIIVVLLFYARLIQLRGHHRKQARLEVLRTKKYKSKSKPKENELDQFKRMQFQVTSWYLLAPGVILFLVGLGIRTTPLVPAPYNEYWWVGTVLGGIFFLFSFK
jgi:uncharacterized membrane protein